LQPLPGFLPLPLVGYGVSLTFAASLYSLKNGSLAITLRQIPFIKIYQTELLRRFKNDRQVFNTVEKKQFTRAVILERWKYANEQNGTTA
ncbi:MAG: hypothetical protein E6164_06335, partial [Dialister sp.]|nr:hypothetical protein [Dialister sp.]